ncbi:hypothetical protein ACFO3O_06635 [Dokdonia ponticola]|uniref:Lipoprotein n=1 Tax=Dokdonia ponticola TaxID=2041041 RepID=A0ABV9HVP9_9FLAO
MKKLFLVAVVFGSMFFTSCDPEESLLDEFQTPQACCGEDETIPPPPPPPPGSGNNGG